MSATTEVKVKREKGARKRKSEAISDHSEKLKRSKAPQVTESNPPQFNPPATNDSDVNSDVDAEEDKLHEERPSKKRKASVDEIEVDITKPEPPSKRALRLLKKGKPLPPSKSGADDASSEPAARKEKKPEAEKRSEHAIWIGNLPWSISKDDLRKFFTEYSDITDDKITRINMPGPQDSKPANRVQEDKVRKNHNKGFAYVDFSTAEAVEQAVELSEQLLGGRRVLIKNHKSFEGRPEKPKEETIQQGKPPSKKVFMGNLSFDTTEESLKEHFEKCGPIESVKIATFEDSGKCKGYAWVTFEELAGAASAVKGYVMIKEEIEGEESESEDESDSESEEAKKPKAKATKTRKWWVNRIKGRPLRTEFAEDAQVRYKKRYGKDGTKNKDGGSNEAAAREEAPSQEPKVEYRQPYAPRLTGGIIASKGKRTTFQQRD